MLNCTWKLQGLMVQIGGKKEKIFHSWSQWRLSLEARAINPVKVTNSVSFLIFITRFTCFPCFQESTSIPPEGTVLTDTLWSPLGWACKDHAVLSVSLGPSDLWGMVLRWLCTARISDCSPFHSSFWKGEINRKSLPRRFQVVLKALKDFQFGNLQFCI